MIADRIIVVSGGEVIEEGNHESLMNAGGKYADLWSKQIFVKAKKVHDEEDDEDVDYAGSKSPTIVNDLTLEEAAAELAKVDDGSTRAATPEPTETAAGSSGNDHKQDAHEEESNSSSGSGDEQINDPELEHGRDKEV
jgi:hypothetical protein